MPTLPFANQPPLAAGTLPKPQRRVLQLLKNFLLTAALDAALVMLTFYITFWNSHGKGGPDADSMVAALAFVSMSVVLRLVLVLVLVRTRGYAQGVAALPGLVPLGLLLMVLWQGAGI